MIVNDLAEQHGVSTTVIIDWARHLGIDAQWAGAELDEHDAQRIAVAMHTPPSAEAAAIPPPPPAASPAPSPAFPPGWSPSARLAPPPPPATPSRTVGLGHSLVGMLLLVLSVPVLVLMVMLTGIIVGLIPFILMLVAGAGLIARSDREGRAALAAARPDYDAPDPRRR